MTTELPSELPSSLEIAQAARLLPIGDVAAAAGLLEHEFEPYGRTKAKVSLGVLDRLAAEPAAPLVLVTAITPTPAGEGKTTTAIALADGLGALGRRSLVTLREASLGPVFGIKGGAAGGGYAQVVPMEELNLHFTGDLHAITAANNLIAALLEASIHHGNPLGIDPNAVTWRRCLDVNDRALRDVVVGLGGRVNGFARETGFDITAASEVMAVLALARDLPDLRNRLGAVTVARTFSDEPVTAEDLRAAGSATVLLKDALMPNLVQTLGGRPALVHAGPFANIAHGHNSLVADRVALKLADVVVTESGFGSDMGLEKFVHLVCRLGGIRPAAVVLVATVSGLKHHGGDIAGGLDELRAGAVNLGRHLGIVRAFGLEAVVAVNRRPGDTDAELELARGLALEHGALSAEVCEGYERGAAGATALAAAVLGALERPAELRYLYDLDAPFAEKIDAVARGVYGADGAILTPQARRTAERLEAEGLRGLPVCIAKTPLSLSHDPALLGAPAGFTVPVRDLRAYTGAGWVVALCGDLQTMPGLGAEPAAFRIDVDDEGRTVGLF